MLCHYADKSCGHKHCDGGDMFLICHVASCEHMFKGLCEFMSGSHHLAMFGGHWSSACGDIMYLTCHMTLQYHVIEGSSNFMSRSSSWDIATLSSLLAIGIVIVEICFYFVT